MSNNNSIICIKKNKIDAGDILPGYEKKEQNYDHKIINCWNCTHEINMRNLKYIPIKYDNFTFYITGYFCSDSCCLRYIYDNFNGKELWDKYELFGFYYQKLYGKNLDITIPPNKLLLKKFGGNIDIKNYVKDNNYNEIIIPSIVVPNNLNNDTGSTNNTNNHNLKLFRKKNKKNTILTNMDN